jgi:hypothetical protein
MKNAMNEFERYLHLYEIDPVRLSIVAKVRYLTVSHAMKGNPLFPENAEKIKEALLRLTGVPYEGTLKLIALNDKLSEEPFLQGVMR